MYCNNCGHKNDDGMSFCVECGSKLETSSAKTVRCAACGNVDEAGNAYCERCGTRLEQKKQGGRKIGIALISAVMAVILVFSAVFGCMAATNPMLKIQKAAKNTLKAKSAEFEIVNDDEEIEINGEIELDLDKEYFCLHLKFSDGYDDGEGWMRYEDSRIKAYERKRNKIEREEIPEEAEEAIEKLFDMLKGEFDSLDEDDLEEFFDIDDAEDYIHIEKLEKVCKKIVKKLASKENMKKVLGYEKSKRNSETVYSFEPNLYELVLFLIDNSEELFTPDAYDDILEAKEDLLYDADPDDYPRVNISFSTAGKYLTGCEIETEDFDMEVKLSNINKTSVDFPNGK